MHDSRASPALCRAERITMNGPEMNLPTLEANRGELAPGDTSGVVHVRVETASPGMMRKR